ncbi:MAG: SDR family oxidoreductase [Thermoleophilia bacterium]|nr:SDR family oxidoreductase [Thermoleophilia bacterium]
MQVSGSGGYKLVTSAYEELKEKLRSQPRRWLITGVAGFIGSHLLETLLSLNQQVAGIDNFSTGFRHNLEEVEGLVKPAQWSRFDFIEGDICVLDDCRHAMAGAELVLHQAALGSVPRSLENPIETNASNITGFLNILVSCRETGVARLVYAGSSSTYGDHPDLPKVEEIIGRPLSPYAVTKVVNELYADVFQRCYGLQSIGLRYFNVFGTRQNIAGPYAAVIPAWFNALLNGEKVFINGDGETSRDFCYISNAVQANLLAACTETDESTGQVYNVACSRQTSLNRLFELIRDRIAMVTPSIADRTPLYSDFRPGDVRHSLADISKARKLLGFEPSHSIDDGLAETTGWFIDQYGAGTDRQ